LILKEEDKDKKDQPEADYYVENGLFVFTKSYHLRRGYCCKNGCRNCPYGFDKSIKETKSNSGF
jgi:Family of unknown function (DUF5522)